MPHEINPGYKQAAIDWLLAHGSCERIDASTTTALFDLADRGVDYAASDLPDFNHVAITAGDSFSDPTYATALSGRVVPLGAREHESYTFVVDPEDWNGIVFSFILRGVLAAADGGDTSWKSRFPDARARHDARKAEQAAREAGYAAARAVEAAGGNTAEQTAAANTARAAARAAAGLPAER